jgi:hypothetical protein
MGKKRLFNKEESKLGDLGELEGPKDSKNFKNLVAFEGRIVRRRDAATRPYER